MRLPDILHTAITWAMVLIISTAKNGNLLMMAGLVIIFLKTTVIIFLPSVRSVPVIWLQKIMQLFTTREIIIIFHKVSMLSIILIRPVLTGPLIFPIRMRLILLISSLVRNLTCLPLVI